MRVKHQQFIAVNRRPVPMTAARGGCFRQLLELRRRGRRICERSTTNDEDDEAVWQDGRARVGNFLGWGRLVTDRGGDGVNFACCWIQSERAGTGLRIQRLQGRVVVR
jgi:hypothetical protein